MRYATRVCEKVLPEWQKFFGPYLTSISVQVGAYEDDQEGDLDFRLSQAEDSISDLSRGVIAHVTVLLSFGEHVVKLGVSEWLTLEKVKGGTP